MKKEEDKYVIVDSSILYDMREEIKNLLSELCLIKRVHINKIYNNTEVKELLGVQDKLLKKYRDNGLLAYSQVGDKYWYTQADIDKFLESNYFAAFNVA